MNKSAAPERRESLDPLAEASFALLRVAKRYHTIFHEKPVCGDATEIRAALDMHDFIVGVEDVAQKNYEALIAAGAQLSNAEILDFSGSMAPISHDAPKKEKAPEHTAEDALREAAAEHKAKSGESEAVRALLAVKQEMIKQRDALMTIIPSMPLNGKRAEAEATASTLTKMADGVDKILMTVQLATTIAAGLFRE